MGEREVVSNRDAPVSKITNLITGKESDFLEPKNVLSLTYFKKY